MYGPQPSGHWSALTAANTGENYRHLICGQTYVVLKAFVDFDADAHPCGERWRFLGYAYSPYDEGLSLFVSLDDIQKWQLRMHCVPEAQAAIIHALDTYLGHIHSSL